MYRRWFGENAAYCVKRGEKDVKMAAFCNRRPYFSPSFSSSLKYGNRKSSHVLHRVFHRDFSRAREVSNSSQQNRHPH